MKRRSFIKGLMAFFIAPSIIPKHKNIFERWKEVRGYQGLKALDAGVIYAPYIPLTISYGGRKYVYCKPLRRSA